MMDSILLTNAELSAAIDVAFKMCRGTGSTEEIHAVAVKQFNRLLDIQYARAGTVMCVSENNKGDTNV